MFKKLIVSITFIAAIQLAPGLQTSQAVERSCGVTVLNRIVGAENFPNSVHKFDVLSFAPSQKILFLADGDLEKLAAGDRVVLLGDYLHSVYPNKTIVSTDFAYKKTIQSGNFTKMHLDNTKVFPFADNSFDTIVMRNGLCACHGACCAGFHAQSAEAKQFFREVVRVMDKNTPLTRVVLEGGFKVTPAMQETWKNLLRQIERETKVKTTMHYLNNGEMYMISIRPPGTR